MVSEGKVRVTDTLLITNFTVIWMRDVMDDMNNVVVYLVRSTTTTIVTRYFFFTHD